MNLRQIKHEELAKLVYKLRSTNNSIQLDILQRARSWSLYGIDMVVSLPVYEVKLFTPFHFPQALSVQYIVPYLCYPYIYFIRPSPALYIPRREVAIDYTVTFDTNFASYVKKIVQAKSLGVVQGDIYRTFAHVLNNDLNFDCFFYFIENIKLAYPIALRMKRKGTFTAFEFWRALNRQFKRNIVYLELFRNVDCAYYRQNQVLRYEISFREAVEKSIRFTYDFYASKEGSTLIGEFLLPYQRLILLHILAILRIQFSSAQNLQNKFKQYLDFVQSRGEVYLEREALVAFEYFKDRSRVPIFNPINKGGNPQPLLKRIDSIAWDFAAIRFLEEMFLTKGQGDYCIPFLMSFDADLRTLMQMLPIKAVILDRHSGHTHPVADMDPLEYYKNNGCGIAIADFSSTRKVRERISRPIASDKEILRLIRDEYKQLRLALYSYK